EAYRDLRLSGVTVDDRPLTYVDFLNYVYARVHGALPPDDEFRSGDMPHLAAAYLSNFLARRGHRAEYVDLFQRDKVLLEQLLDADPLCVAITTTLYVLNLPAIDIVRFIRSRNPRTRIVIGGPLIANHARNYLHSSDAAAPVQIA